MAVPRSEHRFSRGTQALLVFAGIVVALLLLLRFVASPVAERMVNRKLSDMDKYTGSVADLHLAIWRGAVDVKDFTMAPRDKLDDPPLVRIERATIVFSWSALFRGKFGGRIEMEGAEMTTIKERQLGGPVEAAQEVEQEVEQKADDIIGWQQALLDSFPMELTKVEIRNSRLRFIDRSHDPVVEVPIEQVHMVITGLTNRPESGEELPAKVVMTALVEKTGQLKTIIRLDPLSKVPRFTANFELTGLALPEMNDFLLAYVNADVSRGTFEMYSEVEAKDGAYYGYVKPFFKDLDFKNVADKDKPAIKRIAEKAVSVVASVLENDQKENVATKAPFGGSFENRDVDIWTTIQNLFRNAFVQALREGLEGETPTG